MLGAGCDLESYAPALAALLASVWWLDRPRPRVVLAALALALATSLHVENALFGLAALTLVPKPSRLRLVAISAGCVVTIYVFAGVRILSLPGASHGFSYPLHAYTPLVAVWGALRSIVFVPYLYEASLTRVVATTVLAALVTLALVRRRGPSLPSRTLLAWTLPYAIVGVLFFPSDPERWIFLVPLFWWSVRPQATWIVGLAALNVILWLPHARDSRGIDAARAAATHLRPRDLVIMPGHGWDESLVLVGPEGVRPFPLVYHAARGDLGPALDEALATSDRVVSVRLDGEDVSGTLGWKELARLDLDRPRVRALLAAHGLVLSTAEGDGVLLYLRTR